MPSDTRTIHGQVEKIVLDSAAFMGPFDRQSGGLLAPSDFTEKIFGGGNERVLQDEISSVPLHLPKTETVSVFAGFSGLNTGLLGKRDSLIETGFPFFSQ
jgi:hypothetical protein